MKKIFVARSDKYSFKGYVDGYFVFEFLNGTLISVPFAKYVDVNSDDVIFMKTVDGTAVVEQSYATQRRVESGISDGSSLNLLLTSLE